MNEKIWHKITRKCSRGD